MIRYLSSGVSEIAHLLSSERPTSRPGAEWEREWSFLGVEWRDGLETGSAEESGRRTTLAEK